MPSRTLFPRFPALLEVSELLDPALRLVVANIKTAAPTSKLVANNPGMAASVAAMTTKDAALATINTTVVNDKAKLHLDLATEAVSRALLQGEVRTYVTYAQNDARSPADLHDAGLVARPSTPRGQLPAVPESIDTKPPKRGRGKNVVSVHETGPTRHQYVAEQSLDGVTWSALGVGHGKTRTLTGASGAKIWVRFATVRSGLQSDWCTAVLVTIP